MVQEPPRVSIVVLSNPSSSYVEESIRSALDQETQCSLEFLVSSDCLAEVSLQFRAQLSSDERVQIWPRNGNRDVIPHPAATLGQCTGDYIAFLECGDLWTDVGKLQQQTNYLNQHQNCAVCLHRVSRIQTDGTLLPTDTYPELRANPGLDDLIRTPSIPASSILVRRDSITPLPDWFERLKCVAWALCLCSAIRGEVGFMDQTLAATRECFDSRRTTSRRDNVYQNRNYALRCLRHDAATHQRMTINLQLAEHHRLMSLEMERQGRIEAADRHQRACFLYGGWKSGLPVSRKISQTLRPYRSLHSIAVSSLNIARLPSRLASPLSFALSAFWHQPASILKIASSIIKDGAQGLSREWKILDYMYGVSRQRYYHWIRQFDTLTDEDKTAIEQRIKEVKVRPGFSVVLPVDGRSTVNLERTITSIARQLYPDWELWVTVSCPADHRMRSALFEFEDSDARIHVLLSDRSGSLSDVLNTALHQSSKNFLVLLNQGDVLTEHALYMVAEELNQNPNTQVIYSDQDQLDKRGRRTNPYFKTDWNPDLMLSHNLISHLAVFDIQLVRDAGGFRPGFGNRHNYDVALRCIERTAKEQIRHIPAVLCHCQQVLAAPPTEDCEADATAIHNYLERQRIAGSVEIISTCDPPHYRVRYALMTRPLVTVIIPTKDRLDLLRRCVNGLLNDTDYPSLEIIIVDNESNEQETLDYFDSLKQHPSVRILNYSGEFNYSSINNFAVAHASGEVICLLNNDTEVIHSDWLMEMVSHAMRDHVGAVGAKLLYPDDTIQHAGVLIGVHGRAEHSFSTLPVETPIQFGRAETIQNVSSVTAACLVLKRTVFEEVAGFDELTFAVAYNDVDLCLRIASSGYRIVWTPYAQLYHHESASRGRSVTQKARDRERREGDALRRRWADRFSADPNLNPNVSIEHADFRPAFPPRVRKPWK